MEKREYIWNIDDASTQFKCKQGLNFVGLLILTNDTYHVFYKYFKNYKQKITIFILIFNYTIKKKKSSHNFFFLLTGHCNDSVLLVETISSSTFCLFFLNTLKI